ncbi:MAG TPA: hypothetical protein VF896_10640 [Anaerolineales bacterium]
MDRDLTIMIYGAIMGVAGGIITSIVTSIFQFWLARRDYESRQSEEQHRQMRQIHLPTDEEVITINAHRHDRNQTEPQRKAAEAGSIVFSMIVGSILVYQANDPLLGFAFTAILGFLMTNRIIRSLRR